MAPMPGRWRGREAMPGRRQPAEPSLRAICAIWLSQSKPLGSLLYVLYGKQLFDSVEAKQYKRPDMNGDLRLGFASDDFAGTKWPPGGATARRRLPSTTLTSPACCGGCARASRPGWTRWKPGRRSGGRRTSRCEQASSHLRNLAQAPFWGKK